MFSFCFSSFFFVDLFDLVPVESYLLLFVCVFVLGLRSISCSTGCTQCLRFVNSSGWRMNRDHDEPEEAVKTSAQLLRARARVRVR